MPLRDSIIRYGIAELFGFQIDRISKEKRSELLQHSTSASIRDYPACPFRLADSKGNKNCTKQGGVCSIRRYINPNGQAERVSPPEGVLTVTCPNRFHQNETVFRWVGKEILKVDNPIDLLYAKEINFLENITYLEPEEDQKAETKENVGRIDLILVDGRSVLDDSLRWCALEIQAVYFSGKGMKSEFASILKHSGEALPFPNATRRPDYRSSGPKRLMPQMQIKIPSLRRWGKKMAVIVDTHFFNWIGRMEEVKDISNSDIVWFVVDFDEQNEAAELRKSKIAYTTLERAIDGLTGGMPVALNTFEERIRNKLREEN